MGASSCALGLRPQSHLSLDRCDSSRSSDLDSSNLSRQSTKGICPIWPIGPLLIDESTRRVESTIRSRSTELGRLSLRPGGSRAEDVPVCPRPGRPRTARYWTSLGHGLDWPSTIIELVRVEHGVRDEY